MKNAKKLLALLLALAMCVGLLAGCNNGETTTSGAVSEQPSASTQGLLRSFYQRLRIDKT